MSQTPITKQGLLVAPGTYAAYEKMRAAFKKATGLDLLITSGYRSYAQQKDLYDRWTGRPGGRIKNPPFYAPSVAKPGTSRHESGRALDLRDSGTSAGVTVAGNSRSNWMRANASKFGFVANGYTFNEPWHFEYQGNPWAGYTPPKPQPKPQPKFWSALTDAEQKTLAARVQNIQDILTGYAPNQYVKKGYSLPLILKLVRDGVGVGVGSRTRLIETALTDKERDSLLVQILDKLKEIEEKL